MPNTFNPILTRSDVQERLKLVPQDFEDRYFMYVVSNSENF